jgi:hypothetical protein
MRTAHRKDWTLMAVMAGKAGVNDERAPRVGRALEEDARAMYRPAPVTPRSHRADVGPSRAGTLKQQIGGQITKLKAHLAA